MSARTELLAPAGSLAHVEAAAAYGADAVYAGVPHWSLRVRGNGFTPDDFRRGIACMHERGGHFYAVFNVIPHMRRAAQFPAALDDMAALHPDALIMSDPGLIATALERHPQLPIHLSVQNNTVNSGTVRFWQRLGIRRCILARELSLREIAMIREDCPDMELEVFVHGALCIAVSGRCLISGLLARRDANLGACTNSCRWRFNVRSLSAEIEEDDRRRGQWMPLEEDEHGSYLLNSRDLCALPVLRQLLDIGVDCLKIEGRSRSPFYAAAMTRAYRLAIDSLRAGGGIPGESRRIAAAVASRPYTTGLLEPHRPDELQDYDAASPLPRWLQVGRITGRRGSRIDVAVLNRFERSSRLLLFTPRGCLGVDAATLCGSDGLPADCAPGAGHCVSLECPHAFDPATAFLLRDDGPVSAGSSGQPEEPEQLAAAT